MSIVALEQTDFYFSSLQTFVFLVVMQTNFSLSCSALLPGFPVPQTLADFPEAGHSRAQTLPARASPAVPLCSLVAVLVPHHLPPPQVGTGCHRGVGVGHPWEEGQRDLSGRK